MKADIRLLMHTNPRLCALVVQVVDLGPNLPTFLYATRTNIHYEGGTVNVDLEEDAVLPVEAYLELRGWITRFQHEDEW
jgi:hypothetical protein